MSMPRRIPTDEFYSYDALRCSKNALFKLIDEGNVETAASLEPFFRLLNDMENQSPFNPGFDSRYSRPILTKDDEFGCRRPVWNILLAVANWENLGHPAFDYQSCAIFLKDKLQLCHRRLEFEKWKIETEKELKKIGLLVCFGGSVMRDILVIYSQEIIGEEARKFMIKFLEEVIIQLEKQE